MRTCLALCLALPMAAFADDDTSSETFSAAGPFPFGLTEEDIDAMIDHHAGFRGILSPGEDVVVGASERAFIKMQLSGGFECWKFEDLCTVYGKRGATSFLKDFLDIADDYLPHEVYNARVEDLIEVYDHKLLLAPTLKEEVEDLTKRTQFRAAVQHHFGADTPVDVYAPGIRKAEAGDALLAVGTARYLWGMHDWAAAVPGDDGATGHMVVDVLFPETHYYYQPTGENDGTILVISSPSRLEGASSLLPNDDDDDDQAPFVPGDIDDDSLDGNDVGVQSGDTSILAVATVDGVSLTVTRP